MFQREGKFLFKKKTDMNRRERDNLVRQRSRKTSYSRSESWNFRAQRHAINGT